MTDSPNGQTEDAADVGDTAGNVGDVAGDDGGIEELAELNDAIKAGFRRASLHWMRAGYEVLAGLGAFLDEIATAGKEGEILDEVEDTGPTRIQLD